MGSFDLSNLGNPRPMTENELTAYKAQMYPAINFPYPEEVWKRMDYGGMSRAIGPKIRKLKEWSKQTEYGGEV